MSSESPLDFFSSSAKGKQPQKKTPSRTSKASAPQEKHTAKSVKELVASKRKPDPKVAEARAILERIDFMNKDLAAKLEAACKATGKTPEELEALIQSTSDLSAQDKQTLNRMKKEFADTIKATSAVDAAPSRTARTSKKEGKPTGDLRTKSIGAKRKWMPVK
jgi:hypothetical protein